MVMDLWGLLLRRLGVATLNFAMLGRWAGHVLQGRIRHQAIAKAEPVRHELALGWVIHYGIGVLFAGLLVVLVGERWLQAPTLGPALLVGLGTVVAPLCFMQPIMGAGFFASRTPTPARNCLKSLVTHFVFGVGLFLSAAMIVSP
ncbi:membrane protein [Pseudomonas sp. KU43P]|nr:membrane protein [Pseudomonas sp. KU43P]